MKRFKKGNILLALNDETTAKQLELYFLRKNFNVFVSQKNSETEKIVRHNAITFVLFEYNDDISPLVTLGEKLVNFDNQIFIFFICENNGQKTVVEQINGNFKALVKPFVMRNLYNRMADAAQTAPQDNFPRYKFEISNITFDYKKSKLTYHNGGELQEKHLTKKENEIMLLLCQNLGRTVPKHRLLMNIWHKDDWNTNRSSDVYMTRLRKYLSAGNNITVEYLLNSGYRIKIG